MTATLLATILMSACAGGTTATSTSSPTAAPREELRIALSGLGNEALDPIFASNQDIHIMWLMFDPIIGLDLNERELSKETGVAKDWTISPDGLVYSLMLRSGLKFHNGDELTAEDVKFTLDRLKGQGVVSSEATMINSTIDAVTVKSPTDIEIRLKRPDLFFLQRLSPLLDTSGFVVPKKYVEQVGKDFAKKPIGSGPYKLVDHQVGTSLTYEQAFPEHFAVGKARFKRVVLSLVSEESTRVAQLQSDAVDLIDVSVENLAGLEKQGMKVFTGQSPDLLNIHPITNKPNEPTKDINLRKALSFAIDREQLNKSLMAGKGRATGNGLPSQAGGAGPLPPDPFDPQKARDFLGLTAYGPGRTPLNLQMQVSSQPGWPMQRLAESVQAMWKANLGIDTTVTLYDQGAFNAKRNAAGFPPQSVAFTASAGFAGMGITLARIFTCEQKRLYACDPEYDKLEKAWEVAPTPPEYNRLAAETEKYLVSHYISIPLLLGDKYYVGNAQVKATWLVGSARLNVRGLVAAN